MQRRSLLFVLALWLGLASYRPPSRDLVAVKAGTIYTLEQDQVLEDGVILVRDGKIVALGQGIEIPGDARIVDYGPDSVLIPGLVAAHSLYASGRPSARTASPGLRAVDGFDFYSKLAGAVSSGVTSMYITPAENRLIAGTGGVVKVRGRNIQERTLNPNAAIHGAVDSSARNTPGFWEPPIPATVDVGIGYAKPQLPKTLMGAMVALSELVDIARSGDTESDYGPAIPADLRPLLEAGVPWRISAVEPEEIRALLSFSKEAGVPLILHKAIGAAELVEDIRASGAAVVYHLPFQPNSRGRDRGKGRDVRWPSFDVASKLVRAGVPVAVTSSSPRDLFFAAAVATRGLDVNQALRTITLTPAEIYGVADRVGSLRPGKDADFVALSELPTTGAAGILATWVGGELAWDPSMHAKSGKDSDSKGSKVARAALLSAPVVVAVEELHVGDGRVLRPGEILLRNGKIADVAEQVARPSGARVVRGKAAMPGMIDALGHLGLEGSEKVPAADFPMSSIVAPGDATDRRVAQAGITTVALSPRGPGKSGTPILAYKPAARDFDSLVVEDPVALRMTWSERDRYKSGDDVRALLAKAAEYRAEWKEYEKALSEWTPPKSAPEKEDDEDEGDEEADEEAEEDDEDEDDKDKKKKKKKRKKGEEEELEPDPVTGVWEAELSRPPRTEPDSLKMRLKLAKPGESGAIEGNLRSRALSETLIEISGYFDRKQRSLTLTGLGSQGWVNLSLKFDEGKFEGSAKVGADELELTATRISNEYVVAKRPERRKSEPAPGPKGEPNAPKLDLKLEPLRAAMEGEKAVIVEVDREDEILACVEAFAAFGIEPILYGAQDLHAVLDRVRGKVRGVLLDPSMVRWSPSGGTQLRTPYSDTQGAGIPVAFHSSAEEGAIDLPMMAAYAVSRGMSPQGALRALTSDAARMLSISERVGALEAGRDADVLLLDGPPLAPGTRVLRTWVNGVEVQ